MTLGVTLGLTGLVVDEGWAYWRQEACLTAAQASAMAGAIYANNANSTWPPSTCTTSSAVSCNPNGTTCPSTLTLNSTATSVVQAACLYAQQNGFKATGTQNVTVTTNTGNSPTASGVTTAYYITVRVAEKVPLTFLSAVSGRTSSVVSGRATAAVVSSAAGDCVYVLDPSGNAAVNASNGVNIQSECGYWINSSSGSALQVVGGASVKAINSSKIYLVGGETVNNGGVVSPTPTASSPAVDPFASRNVPLQRAATASHTYSCDYGTAGGCAHTSTAAYQCDYTNYTDSTWTANLAMSPGVYCGGIQIGNVQQVTFAPGVYILDGGGMNLGGLGGINKVIASGGVSFFITGTASTYKGVTIGNGVPFTVAAYTTGAMQGIVFYQDPSLTLANNSTTTSYFNGGTNLLIAGSIYLPTTTINYSNGTNSSTVATALVVYDVLFTGGTYFKHDGTNITALSGTNKVGMVE